MRTISNNIENIATRGIIPGDKITITKRKVAASVQANVQEGNVYKINEITKTPKGVPVLICVNADGSGRQFRINASRFEWVKKEKSAAIPKDERKEYEKVITGEGERILDGRAEIERMMANGEGGKIIDFVKDSNTKASISKYTDKLSDKDRRRFQNIPFAISEMAWYWAEKARAYCAEHRIDAMKQVSRAYKKTREEYLSVLEKVVGEKKYDTLIKETKEAAENSGEMSTNFIRAIHSISNGLHKRYGSVEHLDLRIYANLAMMVIWAYNVFCDNQDKHIKYTTGTDSLQMRRDKNITIKLKAYMDAMRGDYTLDADDDRNVYNAGKAYVNFMYACEFEGKQ